MPDGASATGKGIRLPVGEIQAGLPASASAPRLAARLGRQRRGGQRSGRYGSRLAALQADTAPASACEAANASARMCARLAFEADPERCEGCRSLERLQEFKLSYRAGEEREYLLRRSQPLARRRHARGCSPEGCAGSDGLSRLTRSPSRGGVATRCLRSGRLPLHWDASERRGGKGRTQICQDYLAISPLTPDPQPGCAPRGRGSAKQLPESVPALRSGLWGT